MIDFKVFVQARMSSSRFPGKVLAPLAGKPLISHVLARVCESFSKDRVVLVTSKDSTDDPLALYVTNKLGVLVFRGSLDDVVGRFQDCLKENPCKWFVRISGDSPVIDPSLLSWMLSQVSNDIDLVTNVAERTFPTGQSIEIVKVKTFLGWKSVELTQVEREHVTPHFYSNSEKYRILSVISGNPELSQRRLVVDTIQDLCALESILNQDIGLTRGYADLAQVDR
jgi:spore coat polysaccharide biosynthesis protein SpsF